MAEVWLARSRGIKGFKKTIVLKTILPHFADNPDFVNMFINEALLASLLNHPNVVQIFDLGEIDEQYFIAMEFVDGRTLRQVQRALAKAKKITPPWLVLHVAMSVCEALEYAHNKCDDEGTALNIVHRDVTPENIMISFAGTAKVLDFGIAKASIAASETKAGTLKGKYAYMAPERIVGMKAGGKPDRRSDIYSLGVLLYELLTGKRPFKADNELSLLRQIAEEDPQPPRERASWVPERLDEIVLRAMARDPAWRYQTAADLREDLHEFLISVDSHPTERHVSELLCKLFSVDSKGSTIRVLERGKGPRRKKTTSPEEPGSRAAGKRADATTDISSETSETSGPGYYAQMLVEGKSFITGSGGSEPIFTRETEEISTSELLAAADREAATVMTDSAVERLPSGEVPRAAKPPPLPPDLEDQDTGSAPQETGYGTDDEQQPEAEDPQEAEPLDGLDVAMPSMDMLVGSTGPVDLPRAGTTGEVPISPALTGPMPQMPRSSTAGHVMQATGPVMVQMGDTQESGVTPILTPPPEPALPPEPELKSEPEPKPEPEPEPKPSLAISPMDAGDGDFPGLADLEVPEQPDIESATSGVRQNVVLAEPAREPDKEEPEEAATKPNLDRPSQEPEPAAKPAAAEETTGEHKDQSSSVWDRPSTITTGWDMVVERRKRTAQPQAKDRRKGRRMGEPAHEPEGRRDPEDQVSVWDTLVERAHNQARQSSDDEDRWLSKSPPAGKRRKARKGKGARKKKDSDEVPKTAESRAREKFELGLSKVKEKDYEGAEAAWNEALELDPKNRVYKGNLKRLQKLKERQ